MAMLPSIASLFGGKAPAPAAPAQAAAHAGATATGTPPSPSQTGNPTVPSSQTITPNPGNPANPAAIPPPGTGDQSPLANFADLWKTEPGKTGDQPQLIPTFNLDPAKLQEAAGKINFTNHIDPALVDKAVGGDKVAFMAVINQAAQFGFANALAASGEITKQSLTTAGTNLTDRVLPQAIRTQVAGDAITASSPIFSDPAVAPMLATLRSQLLIRYPTAAPDEIANMAARYLDQMSAKIVTARGGTITTKEAQAAAAKNGYAPRQEEDWSAFFGVDAA